MEATNIYDTIAQRTQGDIYIGVVGPVRSGKSTFIKRFMDMLVIPNIESSYRRERATDELPQSAAGRTIMTTEPKFVPEQAVTITVDGTATLNVRMIDCVGYIVPSSLGYIENNAPRMVKTPWFEEEIPFNMAAEIGTQKVINEHSTIGLVVTTDGSITEIPRDEYAEAEERVINELREINKPFIVLLNTVNPTADEPVRMASDLETKYGVPVYPVNCLEMTESEIRRILEKVLFEFPVREINVELPKWLTGLDKSHPIRRDVFDTIRSAAEKATKISKVSSMTNDIAGCEYVDGVRMTSVELGKGSAGLYVSLKPDLFYKVLGETTGFEIDGEAALMSHMVELASIKKRYDKIKNALDEVEATGYGIVMPSLDEMSLDEPEIIRQSGRYGIRLRAQAPSIHMLRADIMTEVSPIVGSERQSEDLVNYLLREFEEDPGKIWESNIFGTSLYGLVNEGLHNKLYRMPTDARIKLKETVERIINEGCSGLICIIV
ncbi:MAG: stage IV sporulation protein A [Oscillospiraceae bacterium]|jgi:stage IV sporulation protein A|nr:stage IV sporulation protein A [Oscillospiraceae bacterium]